MYVCVLVCHYKCIGKDHTGQPDNGIGSTAQRNTGAVRVLAR